MAKKFKFHLNPLETPQLGSFLNLKSDFQYIPIDLIDFDPSQPRKKISKERLNELADSIREVGLISPILVKETDGGRFMVVSGERRVRASIIAGLTSIPAVIMKSSDPIRKTLTQLIENIQREDLNPLERAEGLAVLRDTFNLSIREIAARIGISKSQVQRSLQLLALPSELQELVRQGLSESKVLELARLHKGDKGIRNILKLVRKSREDIRNMSQLTLEEVKVRDLLVNEFGESVLLRKNSRGYTVTLSFKNLDEIKRFLLKNCE